uniref:Uncharacterized protein n=1 Tax=Cucumis sativus TaxID=3659 RepID=A0A0A0KKA7_CUCSA
MDVFIPDDYVIRRRIEKKLAAQAPVKTRHPHPADQRPRNSDKEKEAPAKTGLFRFTATGADNVVFNCFSA